MLANILQLSAGILLAFSSFIGKLSSSQILVVGQKPPGTLEGLKQGWLTRIGLVFLAAGYFFPIINWDIQISNEISKLIRLSIGLGGTILLSLIGYCLAMLFAKRGYKNTPAFDGKGPAPDGSNFAIFPDE